MTRATIDGNEAAASVAYRLNEVCCIYPITPSSPMAELADDWSSRHRPNVWGTVPTVVEMQSEGGAAGALHGALQGGALATTFTSSQGLLLMIPNMYKIAGELTSAVIHVAARSIAAQGLSIFGDHQDVMAVRQTGFALLSSASVQEAHDLALVAQAATLRTRIPFVHFFDGFRTSHELNTIELLDDDDLRALVPEELVLAHRARALSPERPFVRGTAQNPDTYFQARETVNPFYARVPEVVEDLMAELGRRTGRPMHIVEYTGHPQAERVVVLMGSGAETAAATVAALAARGERVGVLRLRLYRPFPARALLAALPPTVRALGVLDRTKEPGSHGEPLYLDVVAALAEAYASGERSALPMVCGGRYGLSSKEFTPAMVAGVFAELARDRPRARFTVGIDDDVSGTSIDYDPAFDIEPADTVRAVFFGIGSDGTVGANKNTIKILGGEEDLYAQGYFVYDSKKSGSQTVSHLRFGPEPIRAPYLVQRASFVGCHHEGFLHKLDVLGRAAEDAALLLNTRRPPEKVWDTLPGSVQRQILDKRIGLYVVDAGGIAREVGLAGRINIVLQTCFFAISGVLPLEQALARIKDSAAKTYAGQGADVVAREAEAVDRALQRLHRVDIPDTATSDVALEPPVGADAPEFVRSVTGEMIAGRGDALPVSALPIDGTYPSGTAAYEKRNISELVAVWDPDTCIQCGNCSFVCPHSVIRTKFYDQQHLDDAPAAFPSAPLDAVGLPGTRYTLQVYVEDCTGCDLCVQACPAVIPGTPVTKAINLAPREPLVATERENIAFFETLPVADRSRVDFGTVRGTQFLQPLFEFPGACAGCGETPYLKLLSQLFGDRLVIANATGCSSIYGGNLPTTPWTANAEGRGPAWSNSLFEDNAEFGLGLRLAADTHLRQARRRLTELRDALGPDLVDAVLGAPQRRESELHEQRRRTAELSGRLDRLDLAVADEMRSVIEHLVRRSVWIVGGDGWAYDIGAGGLDHVLASGHNVNVLVLDTEVYSNTGGQMSKSTPLGAVAKFAAGGKTVPRKDLALQAISYGNVYVARVAFGADPQQTLLAFREAEAYDGPSLIIAYSHCIAHGFEMRNGLDQQHRAVASGHWPLIRYDPVLRATGNPPFLLDSHRPRLPLADYRNRELRYRSLINTDPDEAERLAALAQESIEQRWNVYEDMASRAPHHFPSDPRGEG
ncbi:pyruvate ferredoxin/flavodoxin oxidoreductase family protein [Mycobacterium bohemicum DSM 44277]|uniref:Pyruvate-flavodoxin oxidoreductase n=2 Tax=Mycobacterium bohemicum TaxID=56425 RepID=A0A1X1R5I4_MYCBE|nr:pyruvate:ferredoxin (flavodoxin) oxidoreductase [Mycobacterium bohemicum]MCV6970266.1 pyruvate:ferredoxin (flavodoxin) oxidoreductase [Mycobacterium bohemicum]ORU99441.1 pyruvate-flavodoxin oxidoreductase [Mycobacterium bohemicum]CPR13351.1 pyruvate ferredoxin/flavodoxin oxidoreductase family protein [Mycobacterium bohemicum DSM 44277]